MYLTNLKIKNIGPFREGEIEFACNTQSNEQNPVTIITGMNGTGKSVIIDAIRAALSGQKLERNIVAKPDDFYIKIDAVINKELYHLSTSDAQYGYINTVDYLKIGKYLQSAYSENAPVQPWIIDYWSTRTPADSFSIKSIKSIDHNGLLKDVMLGNKRNVDLTNFLCHIDYLRSSDVDSEKELGGMLYKVIKKTINLCLENGTFKHIRRTDLQPIIEQNGHDVTLDKLSSGNLFLIEHIMLLLCKMYSLSVLLDIPPKNILHSPGLLLIDEIENHLHPRWQKSILGIIRSLFPNLQIILTTHSPFILSSLPGIRIYTCKSEIGHSIIVDETDTYSNMPVDEILLSDAFNVYPFNNEITELMISRKKAVETGDNEKARTIASKLSRINPEYFAYLDIENRINTLKK